jgi:hypothetical protein
MSEVLRLGLFVALGGVAVTLLVAAAAMFWSEENRLRRVFARGLEARPDAMLIARGTGRGAALSLASRRIVTAWDRGAWRIDYPIEELIGAELDLDGEVAARVLRGEAGRRLDRAPGDVGEVRLRLLFDDARHPDFALDLWPVRPGRGAPARPREAVAEANRWIARVEAVLRRSGSAVIRAQPAAHQPLASTLDAAEVFDEADEDAV